jgi:hypothetical protein
MWFLAVVVPNQGKRSPHSNPGLDVAPLSTPREVAPVGLNVSGGGNEVTHRLTSSLDRGLPRGGRTTSYR